jgi:hypothetical protein
MISAYRLGKWCPDNVRLMADVGEKMPDSRADPTIARKTGDGMRLADTPLEKT